LWFSLTGRSTISCTNLRLGKPREAMDDTTLHLEKATIARDITQNQPIRLWKNHQSKKADKSALLYSDDSANRPSGSSPNGSSLLQANQQFIQRFILLMVRVKELIIMFEWDHRAQRGRWLQLLWWKRQYRILQKLPKVPRDIQVKDPVMMGKARNTIRSQPRNPCKNQSRNHSKKKIPYHTRNPWAKLKVLKWKWQYW
jgi:hypothetical protein